MPEIRTTLTDALAQGVLVFDGAMGTEIYRHHVFTNRSFDELCLSDPQLIETIHGDYLTAGADVLTTNTFGANRISLAKYGLADKTAQINCAGASLARKAADHVNRNVLVAGSIGPLPSLPATEEIEVMIVQQASSLRDGGADFIIFETQPTRAAIETCARAMRQVPNVPFILSCILENRCESLSGEPVESLLAPLPDDCARPAAFGLNCGSGPDGLLTALERAVKVVDLPIIVQPNAGIPKEVEFRRIYFCSPEYFTEYGKRFITLGASGVGGCCGTTPEHIKLLVHAIKPLSRMRSHVTVHSREETPTKPPAPLAEKSQLGERLAKREWITSVELVPPRGYDLTGIVAKSRSLKERGVTAINIPDGPRASARRPRSSPFCISAAATAISSACRPTYWPVPPAACGISCSSPATRRNWAITHMPRVCSMPTRSVWRPCKNA
jgi:homocysteine S-methyltransferase